MVDGEGGSESRQMQMLEARTVQGRRWGEGGWRWMKVDGGG